MLCDWLTTPWLAAALGGASDALLLHLAPHELLLMGENRLPK